MKGACKDCEWYQPRYYNRGECRAHPPQWVMQLRQHPQHGDYVDSEPSWPIVLRTDWCGEWMKRTGPDNRPDAAE